MVPTPDITQTDFEVRRTSHIAHVRAALAATIIFLVCMFVIAAHL